MQSVLIVEDEPLLLKALFEKLATEFECITANNGGEGIKLAKQHHPNIILLDLVMPHYDGMTLLRNLRQDEWGKNAKVIVLTNLSDERSMEEARKLNIISYLIKANLKLDEVLQNVRSTLGVSGSNT